MMHRLAAEKFANRRTQYRAAVGGAGIGRRSCPFELQFPTLTCGVDSLAERDRPTVAQLPRPIAELVSTVIGRVWLHAVEQRIAAEYPGELG